MDVSLNTFTAFVASSSRDRTNLIRQALLREAQAEFDPSGDFWHPYRRTNRRAHRSGDLDLLRDFQPGDPRKTRHYATATAGYLRWLRGRQVEWVGGPKRRWSSGGLTVRINPELFIAIRGVPHAIQPWYRNALLNKDRVAPVVGLLSQLYGEVWAAVGILDFQRGSLLKAGAWSDGLDSLLVGEAASFVATWNHVQGKLATINS